MTKAILLRRDAQTKVACRGSSCPLAAAFPGRADCSPRAYFGRNWLLDRGADAGTSSDSDSDADESSGGSEPRCALVVMRARSGVRCP